jgi:hypothetical protein
MDALRASRAESVRKKVEEAAAKEAKIRSAFAQKPAPLAGALDIFSRTLAKKAPKLLENQTYRGVVQGMSHLSAEHIRPIQDWEPRGKGCETLFRSLCDHLWAKYPMPSFLWSAFFEFSDGLGDRNVSMRGVIRDIAAGGSLFTYSKEGRFPVPLTRQMVHELMTKTPGDIPFTRALRRIQIKTAGGTPRFFQVWAGTRPGSAIGTQADEAFWATIIRWFSQHPMFDPNQVGPMIDYIAYRRNGEAGFSMKGRSPMAMLRGMKEWHGDLAKIKAVNGAAYLPSGFKEFEWEKSGKEGTTTWTIKEILSSKDLLTEGRELKHCVGSYSFRIEKQNVSIWSLSAKPQWCSEEKVATIEVINTNRSIVQARGKYNSEMSTESFQVMQRWAGENALSIRLGRW